MTKDDFSSESGLIRAHATRQPTNSALLLDGRRLDYAALDAEMNRVAAALQRDGVKPGEAIAISAATSLEYAVVFLGSVRAGVAVAPLAPESTPAVLAATVADCGARLFFLSGPVADRVAPAQASIGARCIALDDSTAGAAYSNWLAAPGACPQAVDARPDWPFNIIYSSGTTGTPKGIVVPYAYRWTQIQLFTSLGYGPDAVTLVSIPLYSNMTLSSFLPTLSIG